MTPAPQRGPAPNGDPLLLVRGLRTGFRTEHGEVMAVDGIGFEVDRGETLALVGESGCGKSVTALSILGLVPVPPGFVAGGTIRFRGRDLRALGEAELRRVRGREIAMIFQEPMTSLNPVLTVGEQVGESLRLHRGMRRRPAREAAIELFARVGISRPRDRVDEYPHQLSGGMRQRVMIAMALAGGPSLLIADEPTTALDVTVQAQILDLLRDVQRAEGLALLFISHDLGVVARMAHRVAVMYAGRIAEAAGVGPLFEGARHPYTRALFASNPALARRGERLRAIPGVVPNPWERPAGCRFRNRCAWAHPRCAQEEPALEAVAPDHLVACFAAEAGGPP